MASPNDNVSMALYCDFENVALGVRDAKYEKFNIKPVLEKLLLKGSIVVKKAYCDWDRYKEFKPAMHEASFELIEIPHVRQSGKNSADIRMVVDALDLCYTKSHVNTFVILSGDSDFSPLVSKLRENAKYVIGVGVKNSSSDLLIANCDEFIFIDDLVRESRRAAAGREARQSQPAQRRSPEEEKRRKEELEERKSKAIGIAVETFDALMAERGDSGKIWASQLKQAIKRRMPDFNEMYFGFRTFGNLLEEAQGRSLLEIGRDDKSGAYIYRSERPLTAGEAAASGAAEEGAPRPHGQRERQRGPRQETTQAMAVLAVPETPVPALIPSSEPVPEAAARRPSRGRRKAPAKPAETPAAESAALEPATTFLEPAPEAGLQESGAAPGAAERPARKSATRSRRGGTKPAAEQATSGAEPAAIPDAAMAQPEAAPEAAAGTARKTAARSRRARKPAPADSEGNQQ